MKEPTLDYAGVDLLADVFEDTEEAPTPIDRRDAGGNLLRLWPSPDDPRWTVDLTCYPDGKVMAVHSVRPRHEQRAGTVENDPEGAGVGAPALSVVTAGNGPQGAGAGAPALSVVDDALAG